MRPAIGSQDARGFALWNLGFRPFYLLASIFAAISVPAWVCQYAGWLPVTYLQGSMWHGHEMIFGFAMAVIAGFLLTAVPNWTKEPTPTGRALAALALLWVAGRVLAPTSFSTASIVVNAAFPLAIGIAIAIPLWKSANRRNYFFAFLLAGMSVALAAFHLASRDSLAVEPRVGLQVALDIVLFIMALVGGRVIPMFTNHGVPGTQARRDPRIEWLALGALLALLACDLLQFTAALPFVLAFAAVAHAARLVLWQPWRTGSNAMVWILHAAYAWIVVHLALRALAVAGLVAPALALHALAIGAIGSLTIGMMTRTARGHTGYPLRAGKAEVACFVLIQLAAGLRVFGAMLAPGAYVETVIASGTLWAAAFATYAIRYWPILTRARIDGRPG